MLILSRNSYTIIVRQQLQGTYALLATYYKGDLMSLDQCVKLNLKEVTTSSP